MEALIHSIPCSFSLTGTAQFRVLGVNSFERMELYRNQVREWKEEHHPQYFEKKLHLKEERSMGEQLMEPQF
jgi:hypothetical protein